MPVLDRQPVVKGESTIRLRDAGDPMASYYYQECADELGFLDISATPQEFDIKQNQAQREYR